jgi:hypothetical protein
VLIEGGIGTEISVGAKNNVDIITRIEITKESIIFTVFLPLLVL